MTDDVLLVQNVRKTFEPHSVPMRARRGADLTMARREFIDVTGPWRCGKSVTDDGRSRRNSSPSTEPAQTGAGA